MGLYVVYLHRNLMGNKLRHLLILLVDIMATPLTGTGFNITVCEEIYA
jgi:hypothetical protein